METYNNSSINQVQLPTHEFSKVGTVLFINLVANLGITDEVLLEINNMLWELVQIVEQKN